LGQLLNLPSTISCSWKNQWIVHNVIFQEKVMPAKQLATFNAKSSLLCFDSCGKKIALLKVVAFPRNSNPYIPGIPAGDVLRSMLNKYSLSSSSLACGLSSPAFIGNDSRIELYFFVGDQPIIQREMEGSDEGEVSLKELKDAVPLLVK